MNANIDFGRNFFHSRFINYIIVNDMKVGNTFYSIIYEWIYSDDSDSEFCCREFRISNKINRTFFPHLFLAYLEKYEHIFFPLFF
jgi:hypothetical protein